jgi:hypothetical protein
VIFFQKKEYKMSVPSAPANITTVISETQKGVGVTFIFPYPSNNGSAITGYNVYDQSENLIPSSRITISNYIESVAISIHSFSTTGSYIFKISSVNEIGESSKTSVGPVILPNDSRIQIDKPYGQTVLVSWDAISGTNQSYSLSVNGVANSFGSGRSYSLSVQPGQTYSLTVNYTYKIGSSFLSPTLSDSHGPYTFTATESPSAILQSALAKPGSNISNIASDIASTIASLPEEYRSATFTTFVESIRNSTDLTDAEKVVSLVNAINILGQSSITNKSLAAAALQADLALQGTTTVLNATQTAALLASVPTVMNPPTTLSVAIPASGAVTLSPITASYIIMTPDIPYTVTINQVSKSITYNASANTLTCDDVDYTVGQAIQFGAKSYRIFATGSSGFEPESSNVPCFPAGVKIRTPGGERAVETLVTGDLVLTATGRVVPVRMHSYSLEATTAATAPYFIPAGALGPAAPVKPLHLSPLHAFQVRPNVWWCAQQAAKVSPKIQQYDLGKPMTYYHVECPNFLRDNLVADGVVVESFAGKQLTATESRNLYKFNKALGGYVRSVAVKGLKE